MRSRTAGPTHAKMPIAMAWPRAYPTIPNRPANVPTIGGAITIQVPRAEAKKLRASPHAAWLPRAVR